jgi:hypothetical protein
VKNDEKENREGATEKSHSRGNREFSTGNSHSRGNREFSTGNSHSRESRELSTENFSHEREQRISHRRENWEVPVFPLGTSLNEGTENKEQETRKREVPQERTGTPRNVEWKCLMCGATAPPTITDHMSFIG